MLTAYFTTDQHNFQQKFSHHFLLRLALPHLHLQPSQPRRHIQTSLHQIHYFLLHFSIVRHIDVPIPGLLQLLESGRIYFVVFHGEVDADAVEVGGWVVLESGGGVDAEEYFVGEVGSQGFEGEDVVEVAKH